jgi:hypothetical protein
MGNDGFMAWYTVIALSAIVIFSVYTRVFGNKKLNKALAEINETETSAQRKLDLMAIEYARIGYLVQSRSDNVMQLVKKKTFSAVWALFNFILIFVYGIGILLLIAQGLMYLSAKDETATVIV